MKGLIGFGLIFCVFVVQCDYVFYSKKDVKLSNTEAIIIMQCSFPMHHSYAVKNCYGRNEPLTNEGDLTYLKKTYGNFFDIYWVPPTLFQLVFLLSQELALEPIPSHRESYCIDFADCENPNYATYPKTDNDVYDRVNNFLEGVDNDDRETMAGFWKITNEFFNSHIKQNDWRDIKTVLSILDQKYSVDIVKVLGPYAKAKKLIFDVIVDEAKIYPKNLLVVTDGSPFKLTTYFEETPVSISLSTTLFSGMYGDTTACTLALYVDGKYDKIAMIPVPDDEKYWKSSSILYYSHMPSLMVLYGKGELFHVRVRYVYEMDKEVKKYAASMPDTELGKLLKKGTVKVAQTTLSQEELENAWDELSKSMYIWNGAINENFLSNQERIKRSPIKQRFHLLNSRR